MKAYYPHLFPQTVLSRAHNLKDSGISALAWPTPLASQVIFFLLGKGIAILGGDILENKNGIWTHLTPNWHTQMRDGESWPAYAERSLAESISFLETHYPERNTFFTLVLGEKPAADQIR